MDWQSDTGLRMRMGVTLLLIAILPLAFTASMTAGWNYVVVPVGHSMDVYLATISFDYRIIVLLTVVGLVVAYFQGGRAALNAVDAKHVSREEYPSLHGRLNRLAKTADMEPPQLAVIDSPAPNAVATGSRHEKGTVAVTTGLRETLDDEELDAVLAHELAHIKNRDATVMSMAYLLPTFTYVISMVTFRLLRVFLRMLSHSGGRSRSDGRGLAVIIVLFLVTAAVTITISAIFWAASFLLFRLLSQYREFAADRGAVAITGKPLALASALESIDDELRSLPDRDLRDLDGGVEALYFASLELPLFNDTDDDDTLLSQELFPHSHPDPEARIEQLQELSRELETGSLS